MGQRIDRRKFEPIIVAACRPLSLTDKAQASGAWDGSSILPGGVLYKNYILCQMTESFHPPVDPIMPGGR